MDPMFFVYLLLLVADIFTVQCRVEPYCSHNELSCFPVHRVGGMVGRGKGDIEGYVDRHGVCAGGDCALCAVKEWVSWSHLAGRVSGASNYAV